MDRLRFRLLSIYNRLSIKLLKYLQIVFNSFREFRVTSTNFSNASIQVFSSSDPAQKLGPAMAVASSCVLMFDWTYNSNSRNEVGHGSTEIEDYGENLLSKC